MRAIRIPAACLLALLTAVFFFGDDHPKEDQAQADKKLKAPTAAQLQIAKAMSQGHAYEKHVVEEKLFPEVRSRDAFAELIAKVLANPTHHRKLENDREAFFDKPSNTIIIYNPHARDRGTCFRPRAGLRYYDGLK